INEEGQVRITDFGIAVAAKDTGPLLPIGTPDYMAPEQLVPGAPLTERTDVYALGLLLYELVVGEPYSRAAARMDPARPPSFPADVNAQPQRGITRALPPDPRDRPPTADAVAALLPASGKPGRIRATRWWLVAAAASALLAVAVVATPF